MSTTVYVISLEQGVEQVENNHIIPFLSNLGQYLYHHRGPFNEIF